MKKLTYFVLICAIIASYSTISRAADADTDEFDQEKAAHSIIIRDEDPTPTPASDELNLASFSRISEVANEDPDELNQERASAIGVTEEGERDGVLYVKRSRLRKIFISAPGEHETTGFDDPFLNGFKCVRVNNEAGEEEMYILLGSFEEGDKLRFPKGKKLIPCSLISLFPQIPAWGVSVYDYVKKKPSKERSSRRKHRSKSRSKRADKVLS